MKSLFIDVETTGLDPQYNEITQIAALVVEWVSGDYLVAEQDYITPKVLGTFDELVCPDHIDRGYKQGFDAYSYAGIDVEKLETKDSISKVAVRFEEFIMDSFGFKSRADLKSVVFFGQNPKFDYDFMFSEYKRLGRDFPFDFHVVGLDSIFTAHSLILDNKLPTNINQKNICSTFNVKNENPHNALSDVVACLECFRRIIRCLQD